MTLKAGALRLATRAPDKKFMPIDLFMESLAAELHGRAIGVILSGSNNDGTVGLQAIKAQGGIVLAQDEESALHPQMPASAVATGCVDFILPPADIAKELARIARRPSSADSPASISRTSASTAAPTSSSGSSTC
jgi:two-component system CheB/CheR fusion protein